MSFNQWITETVNVFRLHISAARKCKYREKLMWKRGLIRPLFKTSRCEMSNSVLWLMISLSIGILSAGEGLFCFTSSDKSCPKTPEREKFKCSKGEI